jgi:hypothetical protein
VERSASKRRESETKDRAQVAVGRRSQDLLFEAAHRLIHEQEDESIADLLVWEVQARLLSVDQGVGDTSGLRDEPTHEQGTS